jgi:hypothetical protein
LRRAALALLVLAVTLAARSTPEADAGLADRVGATFGLIEAEFIQTFQSIEALVVAVDNDDIFLDVNSGNGARVGQEYTIYRKGETFVHPTTGKPLGRYETVLGYAQVRRVQDRFSVATFMPLPDRPPPRAEDGARITRGRIKVAITPVLDMTHSDADVRRVPFLIATSLERSKRFQVLDPLAVGDMFANGAVRVEEVLSRPERAIAAAKNLEVAGWIIPMLLERRGVVYLDFTYISAVTGAPIFSRRIAVVPPGATDEQRFPWEPRAED